MTGKVVSGTNRFALKEVSERCGVPESTVKAYIEEGVIEAEGDSVARWRFSEVSVVRVQKAQRLERDLGLNPAGVAVALDLMAQIDALRARLARLERDED